MAGSAGYNSESVAAAHNGKLAMDVGKAAQAANASKWSIT
jgi:hypothetical protein